MSLGMVSAGLGAASAAKGLFGGSKSGGTTSSKEPWGPAAGWLKDNLKSGQALQGYYEQNPFNALQQTAYQRQFSNNDNFQNDLMPALMKQIGGLLGPNFQLPQSYKGGGGGMQGSPMQGGSMGAPQEMQGGLMAPQGSPLDAAQKPQMAQYAQPNFGQIDWRAMNPYQNGGMEPSQAPPPAQMGQGQETPEQKKAREFQEMLTARFA